MEYIPKHFIELAMQGGWSPLKSVVVHLDDAFEQIDYDTIVFYKGNNVELCAPLGRISIARTLLDPTFWQCLGKIIEQHKSESKCNHQGCREGLHSIRCPKYEGAFDDWCERANHFFNLILQHDEASIKAFWEGLKAKQ